MIHLLLGDNSFEIERTEQRLLADFDGVAEKIDGSEVVLSSLPDLLMGATLFASKRLVIIKHLSENKAVWNVLSEWVARLSDDITLVLIESKPDKRTKTYKELQKRATVQEHTIWGERDLFKAESWIVQEAKERGITLDKKSVQTLVARVGVDQWQLHQALQKLRVAGEITPQVIEELIEARPSENVFNLFETVLKGDVLRVKEMLQTLELSEDPFRLFGLLTGQAFQLALLSVANKPHAEVAKEFGVHPFALSKMAPYAKKLSSEGARKVITLFADADQEMKTSAADPWLLIERALIKVAMQ